VTYILALPLAPALAAILLTFALREIAIRQLWRWTLQAAASD